MNGERELRSKRGFAGRLVIQIFVFGFGLILLFFAKPIAILIPNNPLYSVENLFFGIGVAFIGNSAYHILTELSIWNFQRQEEAERLMSIVDEVTKANNEKFEKLESAIRDLAKRNTKKKPE